MIRIVADDKIPFLRGVFEPYAEIEYVAGGKITRDMLIDADALIRFSACRYFCPFYCHRYNWLRPY
jgi:erythronate-4-phosphate dehydrogenase